MGKQKEQVKNLWDKYMDWLDHISTYVDTPMKVRNLIIRNGKKIVLWIYLITTIWTMIGVYMQGECLNCEKLSQEEAYKILNLDKKKIPVNTENFQTNKKGIFAIGDICTYPGKLKLILSGFHEGALAARACFKLARPNEKYRFEFTTTSENIKERLGVKKVD